MRMSDLTLDIIKAAHAEDIEAYKRTKASPQHLHRNWLLRYIENQEEYIASLKHALGTPNDSIHTT